MKIGFIFPSSEYLHDPFRGDPHTHFQILTILESHFGSEVDVSLIDLRGIKKRFAIYHIQECDVYLHSLYTLDLYEQESIVEQLKQRYPTALHIAGGPHATAFQEKTLEVFDAIVLGDGEQSIIQVIEDIRDSKLKKRYISKSTNINDHPYPLRKYLPKLTIARPGLLTLKNTPGYDKIVGTTTMFSRGCPYSCSFCAMPASKQFSPGIRFRSPELIKEEIEYLKREYGVCGISMVDEICMPLKKSKAIPHLEAIGSTGVVWKAQCRVDSVTPEIASLSKDAGCIIMCMGVESVSQQSLDIINKKIKVERARKSIKLLKKAGIETRIYMILGLPGEPTDIVDKTWDFIQETGPDAVYLSLFTVRPGTPVYDNPKKFGIKEVKTSWENTMHMYSRYEEELPTLTFEYDENTPWGKGEKSEVIINNYLKLQDLVKSHGYGPVGYSDEENG